MNTNPKARRAVDPVKAQADEIRRLTERLKNLQTIVDELSARALTNALADPTNTENTEHDHTNTCAGTAAALVA